ncbi:hypothetical protein ACFX1X_026265 [Malus domestica]
MDVVTTKAAIPTYRPLENIHQFNDFAEFLGDGRAGNARALWNKPLKTVNWEEDSLGGHISNFYELLPLNGKDTLGPAVERPIGKRRICSPSLFRPNRAQANTEGGNHEQPHVKGTCSDFSR